MNINLKYQKLTEKMLKQFNKAMKSNSKDKLASDSQYTMNTLLKQIPTDYIRVIVENDLVDSGISKKEDLLKGLNNKINKLGKVNSSKNKIKKAKKAMKRVQATKNNLVGDKAIEWFMTPMGKNIKVVKPNQVKGFLEELAECLGPTLLPSEQASVNDIKAYKASMAK